MPIRAKHFDHAAKRLEAMAFQRGMKAAAGGPKKGYLFVNMDDFINLHYKDYMFARFNSYMNGH